ncbi:MAG: hypothetical protein P4L10_12615 [Acidobacteriaceae bacterium]|nr:hypothetical protein [Acidobacteriaceae bacterium]
MTVDTRSAADSRADEEALQGDLRWEVAERAIRSPALSRAAQLQAILRFIVRQAILRPEEPLHEFEIAHQVLGRKSDFNALDDNIVRVQMARLRKRLDLYFSLEGKDEQVEIVIALGSYKPVFNYRSESAHAPESVSKIETVLRESSARAGEEPAASPAIAELSNQTPVRRSGILWSVAACLVALILGAFAGFRFRPTPYANQTVATITNPILRRIFSPGATVNMVLADTNLATLLNAIHRDSISVGDYESTTYPDYLLADISDPALREVISNHVVQRFTPLADADIAAKCYRWGTIAGTINAVKYGRYMHVRDFQQGNFVIVGDRLSNPWITLFEPRLNFYQEKDPATPWFHFRNRNPRPGESQTYELHPEDGGSYVGYVDIAILPNLSGTGSVLLLNGLWGDMDDAAADLVLGPDLPPALSHALVSQSDNSTTEILLKVHDLHGSQWGTEIVSIRTSTP